MANDFIIPDNTSLSDKERLAISFRNQEIIFTKFRKVEEDLKRLSESYEEELDNLKKIIDNKLSILTWTHADATARTSEIVKETDIGKVSLQTNSNTGWILTSHDPATWLNIW